MEPARPQAPPEITISTSPRTSSFFDRVLRRTSSGSSPTAARIPTLNLPPESTAHHNTSPASPGSHSRSSSRSSHKRAPLTIDTSVASASMMSNKKTKSTHLMVDTTSSRSRSRSRTRSSRSPSPNVQMINHRVASINHVGRHTNDWLFGGFHLTSKIGAPRGRSRS